MSKHTLEVPFDIGMLLTMNKQLVVIISNEPKDERLVDIINQNDEFYAFFVNDMEAYKVLADGLDKAKRTYFPVLVPHTPKSHQQTIMEFLKNAPINIPLHVSDAQNVEDLFDTSLLEEMRRGYGGDYMNLLDFDRPESRSAGKSLLPKLRDVPESAQFGVSSQEHLIGGDMVERPSLIRRLILGDDLYKLGEGRRMITRPLRSDIHIGYRRYPLMEDVLSYTAMGGEWIAQHNKKNKPPAAAKVRGLNRNGMPSKRGKGRS